jgi:hypothetical protein
MGDLLALWTRSADRLDRRLAGLEDSEFFWKPVADSWTVYPTAAGWTYDYEFPAPTPAPVTSIAWRLVHIAANNWIYWEYAFGAAKLTFPDLAVPSTAAQGLANWHASTAPVLDWLTTASEADLDQLRPNHLGPDLPVREIVAILLDEQIHHGAEIALLRDLYLRQAAT